MSKTRSDATASVVVASVVTVIDILHKKIGGIVSGFPSEPHTWSEILNLAPSFLITFVITFLLFFAFFSVGK